MRMPDLAALVVGLLDELDLEQVDVLGYSWGGVLAQQLTRDAPERVRRLMLVLHHARPGWPAARPLAALGALAPAGVLLRQPPHPFGYAAQLYAFTGWTSLPWLHRLEPPTLAVGEAKDALVPVQNLRALADLIPDARLEILPDAGHLWLLEHPEQGAVLVTEFLDA